MSMGYSSVFANAITIPNELSGLVTCFQYWVPEKRVPPVAWILIFLFAYLFINIFAVNFFGEFESLTSFIKFSFSMPYLPGRKSVSNTSSLCRHYCRNYYQRRRRPRG